MAYRVNYPHLGESGSIESFDVSAWPNDRIMLGYVHESATNLWQFVKIVDAANAAIGDVLYWKDKVAKTVTPTIGNSSAGEVAGIATAVAAAANDYVVVKQRGLFNVKANGVFADGVQVWSDSGNNRVIPAGVFSGALVATADTAGAIMAVANPCTGPWMVTQLIINRATASTSAGTADFGIAAGATTLNDGLIDGLNLNATAANGENNFANAGTNGKAAQYGAAGTYLTGSTASGAVAGLVGTYSGRFVPTGTGLLVPQLIGVAQGTVSSGKVSVMLDLIPA